MEIHQSRRISRIALELLEAKDIRTHYYGRNSPFAFKETEPVYVRTVNRNFYDVLTEAGILSRPLIMGYQGMNLVITHTEEVMLLGDPSALDDLETWLLFNKLR